MAINPLYIPLFTIEEVILDKDSGLPLSGGVVTFYRDSQRLTPKPVYQITGVSPNYMFTSLGNELTLGIAGDFVDNNGNPIVPYAFPYDSDGNVDLYYVTVVSQGGVDQFVRQAVPYIPSGGVNPGELGSDGNQISNPQFVEVLFSPDAATTIPVTGADTVTPIAPGWDLITTGSGNVVVERLQPTASNTPTNPPFSLRIDADAALGATVTLRQRLYNTPSIFRGGFASATFTAAVISGGGSAISLKYHPSVGTDTTLIPNTAISTDGAYHTIAGNNSVTVQGNDPASTGYVDILITIPTGRNIAITSIQVVGLAFASDLAFDEQTSARQKDHLFHYYENSLVRQSKENLLVGWNFGLNPWQFRNSAAAVIAPQCSYVTDQTILYQETASAIEISRAAYNLNYGLQVAAVNGVDANKFAIIQYIDTSTIAPYWGQKLSCLVRGLYVHLSGALARPQLKMRMIWRTNAVPTLGAAEPITGFDANGDPTFAAGWNVVKPLNDIFYNLTDITGVSSSNLFPAMPFDQFQLPTPNSGSIPIYLGVVVYINKPMNNALGMVDYLVFDRISLTANDFALDCCNETYDDSLRKCQFYYEKSYPPGQIPGTSTTTSNQKIERGLAATSVGVSTNGYTQSFDINYCQTKRANPVMTLYAPGSATPDRAQLAIFQNAVGHSGTNVTASTTWSIAPVSTDRAFAQALVTNSAAITWASGSAALGDELIMSYHYTADARLGA